MSKSLFFEGLEQNGQVLITEMNSEKILEAVGVVKDIAALHKGVLLDTETTGFDCYNDALIEIGLREFYFDVDYKFIGFGDFYNGLNDPGFPIPEVITEITGLTDHDVKGQTFDWEKINQICESSKIIVAHNAAFDCPFMRAQTSFTKQNIIWGCSMAQIPWQELGFKGRGLEVLAVFHGFYYTGHRALVDVDAVGYLLSKSDYMRRLLLESKKQIIRVKAIKADFDSKDLLKERGYRWDAKSKHWWKDEPLEKIEEIKSWLQDEIYAKSSYENCKFEQIPVSEKFISFS